MGVLNGNQCLGGMSFERNQFFEMSSYLKSGVKNKLLFFFQKKNCTKSFYVGKRTTFVSFLFVSIFKTVFSFLLLQNN